MTHAQDPRTTDSTDDLLTGRHRDADGREHDVVTEATAEAAGTTGEEPSTGAVTDR